jgi:hypothetical protein
MVISQVPDTVCAPLAYKEKGARSIGDKGRSLNLATGA